MTSRGWRLPLPARPLLDAVGVDPTDFADDTDDDGTPIYTPPFGLRRPGLPYAAPESLAHPRLIRRSTNERQRTAIESPRRRLARSSSPELRAETELRADTEFDCAMGSAPSPMPQPPAPMFLPRRSLLPPPLRHRPAPAPLRLAPDDFEEDMITMRVR